MGFASVLKTHITHIKNKENPSSTVLCDPCLFNVLCSTKELTAHISLAITEQCIVLPSWWMHSEFAIMGGDGWRSTWPNKRWPHSITVVPNFFSARTHCLGTATRQNPLKTRSGVIKEEVSACKGEGRGCVQTGVGWCQNLALEMDPNPYPWPGWPQSGLLGFELPIRIAPFGTPSYYLGEGEFFPCPRLHHS